MLKTKRQKIKKTDSGLAQLSKPDLLGFTSNSDAIFPASRLNAQAIAKKARSKAAKSLTKKSVLRGDPLATTYTLTGREILNIAVTLQQNPKAKVSKRHAAKEDAVKHDPNDHEFLKAWREAPEPSDELVELMNTRVRL
jgi:hypothetical protein